MIARSAVDTSADPARARARFHYPKVAFNRPIPKVTPHVFQAERDQAFAPGTPTSVILLDRSPALGLPWPATLPTMLAAYLVLRSGENLTHLLNSDGEVYYALRGEGVSTAAEGEVRWEAGDAFCFGGGERVVHHATYDSILFRCTDEPNLGYLRATAQPGSFGILPTLFSHDDVRGQLDTVHADPSEAAAGKAVILVTEALRERQCATPTLSITFNTLEPGGDQRPHQHSSAALTLSIHGEGLHSLVDGERVEWSEGLVMLTPPCAPHSHHNRGPATMLSFVVQDSPLHAQMRTTSFQFTE